MKTFLEEHIATRHDMNKVVRLGTSKTYGGRTFSTYAHIKYRDGNLSITGVEGPLPGGNALGSCGQIGMSRSHIINLAPGWTRWTLERFWQVWGAWHLNNMQAACEHQRELGWTWKTHPNATCPVCDYKLGSKWLKAEVPKDVIEFLESLPITDKIPAWI